MWCCIKLDFSLHGRPFVYYMKKGSRMSLRRHGLNSIYIGDARMAST